MAGNRDKRWESGLRNQERPTDPINFFVHAIWGPAPEPVRCLTTDPTNVPQVSLMFQTPHSPGFCGWLPAHATAGGQCEHLLIVGKHVQINGSRLQDGEKTHEFEHCRAPPLGKQDGAS